MVKSDTVVGAMIFFQSWSWWHELVFVGRQVCNRGKFNPVVEDFAVHPSASSCVLLNGGGWHLLFQHHIVPLMRRGLALWLCQTMCGWLTKDSFAEALVG